jgi:hypothetical protein
MLLIIIKLSFYSTAIATAVFEINLCVRISGRPIGIHIIFRWMSSEKTKEKNLLFVAIVADKKFSYCFYLAGEAEDGYHVAGKYFGVAIRYNNGAITEN